MSRGLSQTLPLVSAPAIAPQQPFAATEGGARQLRRAVAASVTVLAVLVGARLWLIDGILRPVTIDGPSMAPGLCGPHYEVICADCRFHFRCDAEHAPPDRLAVCPNCGHPKNDLEEVARLRPAERVLLDRWPLLWSEAKRGDVVAAHLLTGDTAVKRVAAVDGQQLAIDDGDLYDGEKLLRKSLPELRAVRLLVHDNRFRPRSEEALALRWRGIATGSKWQETEGGFRLEASAPDQTELDWLQYHHWSGVANPLAPRTKQVAVRDNDSYNQGPPSRDLNAVHDVQLSCRLLATGQGRLALAALNGGQRFEVILEPPSRLHIVSDGEPQPPQTLDIDFRRQAVELEFGLCDQQLLLAINNRVLVSRPYGYDRRESESPALHPLAIGAAGMSIEVSDLRVWRDVHYLDDSGLPRRWEASPLATSQVMLLGDNPPVSVDSRHWQPAAVSRRAIVGRVYRPFWAPAR